VEVEAIWTVMVEKHRRMVRGGHRLPKVSLEPVIPYPSMPRVGGLWISSTPWTPHAVHLSESRGDVDCDGGKGHAGIQWCIPV
jgi:hypothetical protein